MRPLSDQDTAELRAGKGRRLRVAFIVSHPIQYYAPLYQRLARRHEVQIKVFFTWHAGTHAVHDHGFGMPVAWDIPLAGGYDFEAVENVSRDPGTHHFWGLRNPSLVSRILDWRPDAVHVTGWAWASHLKALKALHDRKVPLLFRGDSHLLDDRGVGMRWWFKKMFLRHIYRWPALFLVTGKANRAYYQAFGVEGSKLVNCPHSIDVSRFAASAAVFEDEARRWREDLGISSHQTVLLFAGKFEQRKRPLEFMKAVEELKRKDAVAIMVGGGELQAEIEAAAKARPDLFKILPFQNQSRMPVVYRLADLFVLPSANGETWGLAVNEALACGRPVLVSDKVGCAADVVDKSCGRVFSWAESGDLSKTLSTFLDDLDLLRAMRGAASARAWDFDLEKTEAALLQGLMRLSLHG